jgi:integrase
MKRRDKGAGTLRKRPDGTWEGRVELEPGPNGQRRRRSVYGKTKGEVQQKIRALLSDQEQGVNLAAPRQTVAQFLAYWLEEVVERSTRPKTFQSYEQVVRCYHVPHIGHIQLDKLTPGHVQRMINTLSDTDLSARTVRYALTVLRIALNVAVRQGYIARNVAQVVEPPSVTRFQGQALTPDQAHTLLAHVEGHRLSVLYHVAVFCGLRRGELLTLRWSDIDFDAGTMRVAESKSDAGRRTIPLGPRLIERLREHWRWQQEERRIQGMRWREHGLVFPSNVGTPLSARNLFRHFKDTLRAAGLPDVRFHDLRHTCATLLASAGTPPAVAMRILGHSQIAMTMEVYTHAQLDDMRAALARLDDALGA